METSSRPKKTDIVRKRTGCQNCKTRRRKCDETRPECSACVHRGIKCSGYDRPVSFKDVTALAAESSKRFEAARWSALRLEDARRKRRRTEAAVQTSDDAEPVISAQAPTPAPPPPWQSTTSDAWLGSAFALPWALFDTTSNQTTSLFQNSLPDVGTVVSEDCSTPLPDQVFCEARSPNHTPSQGASPTVWDEFLVPQESPVGSTPSDESLLGEPTTDLQLSIPLEECLVQHFDKNVVPAIPVALAFSTLFQDSSCFRAAVLALSASHLKLAQRLPFDYHSLRRICEDKSVWIYYDTAVKDLQTQLTITHAGKRSSEDLAGAALLLAYHELEAGSALGIRNHANGLDAIASKLDFASSTVPDLFKAWRMLRFDVRFMMTPTRRSCNPVDNYDVSSLLDPQLAIRDILSRAHMLYARHMMESSFMSDPDQDSPSASERAARWICSVLGRECDHRNFSQGDFYKDNLTRDVILQQCDTFSRRLDAWHGSLCSHDLPVANLGTDHDFISGPTFETVTTYRFADGRKAMEYILYLISRMTVNHLRSAFDSSFSAAATDAWAKVILGIVCGMNILQRQHFTVLRVDILLLSTAYLCESSAFATTLLDYLIPKVMKTGLTAMEMVSWALIKSSLELWMKEKMRGRAVRFTIAGVEEDSDPWCIVGTHQVAVFGDCNGKGYFRDCFVVDHPPA